MSSDDPSVPPEPADSSEEEAGDRPVAALPLDGGRAIADPFHRTTALVEMLDLRARQLRASTQPRAGRGERFRNALHIPRIRPHAS